MCFSNNLSLSVAVPFNFLKECLPEQKFPILCSPIFFSFMLLGSGLGTLSITLCHKYFLLCGLVKVI